MKRIGNLWPGVITFDNLYRAAYRVLRGKRGQVRAGHFFFDLEGELFRLQRELISQIYRPGGYRTFWISDPKPRLISAASFRDRIVHHALVQVWMASKSRVMLAEDAEKNQGAVQVA